MTATLMTLFFLLSVKNFTATGKIYSPWGGGALFFLYSTDALVCRKTNTVDSRYLEFQGDLRNTSRYPYLDISDLQN